MNLMKRGLSPMNIEFDAYKVRLNDVKPALDDLAGSLKV